jgi:hypothetical protein
LGDETCAAYEVYVKHQCCNGLLDELEAGFPTQVVIVALGIIYSQYWLQEDAKTSLSKHLEVIMCAYGTSSMINGVEVPVSLNSLHLDMQADLLKITMKKNERIA